MSTLKTVLEIHPTHYSDSKETKEIKDIECPRCNGRGGFTEQTGPYKHLFLPCDLCHEAKRVKAIITIEWVPYYGK